MELSVNRITKLIGLIIFYTLLATLGVYYAIGGVLFPIFALPLGVYCIRNKMSLKEQAVMQLLILLGIYLITGSTISILIYAAGVCIPAYIVWYFYKEEFSLPNIIMYTTLCLALTVFVLLTVLKGYGIDFEATFTSMMEQLTSVSVESIEEWLISSGLAVGMSTVEIKEWGLAFKEMLTMIASSKFIYGALIMVELLVSSGIVIAILNSIIRRRNKAVPKLNELLHFRISRIAVLILMFLVVFMNFSSNQAVQWIILGMNIQFFLVFLFQIAGMLALLGMIMKSSIGKGMKIMGGMAVFLLMLFSPYLVMIFGCLDSLFNYRKVEIVV